MDRRFQELDRNYFFHVLLQNCEKIRHIRPSIRMEQFDPTGRIFVKLFI